MTTPSYGEYTLTEEDAQYEYQPFDISGFTDFHPIQSVLGEKFDFVQQIRTTTSVYDKSSDSVVDVPMMHVKFSPLLDPIRYVTGKYDLYNPEIRAIATDDMPNPPFAKLGSQHNAAYVDSLFCYLSNQLVHKHGLVNGIRCYGVSSGVQAKYKMNIGNDLDFVEDSSYFRANLSTDPAVTDAWFLVPPTTMDVIGPGSSGLNKKQPAPRIRIDEDILLDGIEELDTETNVKGEAEKAETNNESEAEEAKNEEQKGTIDNDDVLETAQLDVSDAESIELKSVSSRKTDISSRISVSTEDEYEDDDEDDWSTEDEQGEEQGEEQEQEDQGEQEEPFFEEEEELYMYVRNFPVQMIFMEKYEGTLDQLLVRKELNDPTQLSSALMQVIMTLIAYKRAYNFTHNDLHTSNIMYKTTTEEFLYYVYDQKTYKVPTFGRIFSLIDFGRAIFEYKGQRFASDSFASDGDAYTQYNTDPFFNPNKPRIDPNPGFDLCRLGCSLYDLAMDGYYETDELDEFQKTVFRWCQDDSGRNILYKRNGEERYPNFKSYKMIARTSHAHTPEAQLEFPFFSQWVVTASPSSVINI